MVAQLAQFSSVEQATQTNKLLSQLATAQASASSGSLSNLVGRDCNATAADFQLDHGGSVPPLQVSSTSAMNGASVIVTDDNGKELRRLEIPSGSKATQIAWDGKDASGVPVAPGSYHITVEPARSPRYGTAASTRSSFPLMARSCAWEACC
jgi:flagellar hook assembly protein FlgD